MVKSDDCKGDSDKNAGNLNYLTHTQFSLYLNNTFTVGSSKF